MKLRLASLLLVVAGLSVAAQQPSPDQLPRFRSGANLVHLDAYFTKDGAAVTDLAPGDVEVLEDDKPQAIESMELIGTRKAGTADTRREPTTVSDMREMAADPSARLFTLFFDTAHVSLRGSFRAKAPVVAMLDNVIGPDDLVGAMTPDMSASNITYGPRTGSIERFVRDTWNWGERDRAIPTDPRDQEIQACYPSGDPNYQGIAEAMILRRHEQKTLDALDALVTHLDGVRPQRKFVVIFTEGWRLFQRDEQLGRVLSGRVPGGTPAGVGPSGRLGMDGGSGASGGAGFDSCERERVMLAYVDNQLALRTLAQRANRANVSFYPVDARGLTVFDTDIGGSVERALPPAADRAQLTDRREGLRTLALQTDGVAVLDTNNTAAALQRAFADVGAYYLLSYYSTNPKLDGRFRRISVRVKREGVDVRARPGYLAPTEAEARASGMGTSASAGKPGAAPLPPSVSKALDAIAPARGNLPVRIQASGAQGLVRAVVELDVATIKQTEWLAGGDVRLSIEPERGGGPVVVEAALAPGQRSIVMQGPESALAPGRYSVKAEVRPKNGRLPVQATTFATVPQGTAAVGSAALVLRRGPSTGLAYVPTADPRFRRTERLRAEIPRLAEGVTATARVLTREGQPLGLVPTINERTDEATHAMFTVAEVALAPLAEGDYVFEVTFTRGTATDVVSYGFRLVP